jgi:hypothetical protein
MTIVTLLSLTPPPRFPPANQPWTHVRIEESADGSAPWTTIEPAFTLNPAASDPVIPTPYSFTTLHATLPAGWYRVVWIDDAANEQAAPAIHNGAASEDQIRPALEDVANLVASYTSSMGQELGTFTPGTRPTDTEVDMLIDVAVADLHARIPVPIPDAHAEEARDLIALQTATLIQTSRFPDNLDTDRSAYTQYAAMYLQAVEALRLELMPIQIA